jgi:hypothetical protein
MQWQGKWTEVEDTRIPPGQSLEFAPRFASGSKAHVTVTFAPDDYYEQFYMRLLASKPNEQLEQARKRAHDSRFVVYDAVVTP